MNPASFALVLVLAIFTASCSREASGRQPDTFALADVDLPALAALCEAEAASADAPSSPLHTGAVATSIAAASQRLEPHDYLAATQLWLAASAIRASLQSPPLDRAAALRRAAAKIRSISGK